MKDSVASELALLKGQRDRLLDQARVIDRKIGRLAGEALQDEYTSKSGIGRVLGISHTHVSNLIAAADEPLPTSPDRIPVLDNVLAGKYVKERGRRIVRSISGYAEGDVLFQSGLDPRLFADEDYGEGRLGVPAMLWQLDSAEWVGVGEATVGYGGTGCGYSINALTAAGIDSDIAAEIVSWRFCDAVDIDEPSSWQTSDIWPQHARRVPSVIRDRIIVNVGSTSTPSRDFVPSYALDDDGIDPSGFYPSRTERTPLQAWLDFLDDPGDADWAAGPRVARIFLDEAAALAQGFAVLSAPGIRSLSKSIPKIVIEQGHVQIWGHFRRTYDQKQWLPEEAYQALNEAGLYPADLAARDERNTRPLRRLLSSFGAAGPERPFVDVSASGEAALCFTPQP